MERTTEIQNPTKVDRMVIYKQEWERSQKDKYTNNTNHVRPSFFEFQQSLNWTNTYKSNHCKHIKAKHTKLDIWLFRPPREKSELLKIPQSRALEEQHELILKLTSPLITLGCQQRMPGSTGAVITKTWFSPKFKYYISYIKRNKRSPITLWISDRPISDTCKCICK